VDWVCLLREYQLEILFGKNDIEVCFLLETKRAMCCDGFIRMLWNNLSVKWSAVNSFNKFGGILAMWDDSKFMVQSIDCGGQWVALFGLHVEKQFNCAVIGVFAGTTVHERSELWDDLLILQAAFATPMLIVGDFNETLHQYERNSGFLNAIGSADFKCFISSCNLLEYSLSGHQYTRSISWHLNE
jgi:hypothetical protein